MNLFRLPLVRRIFISPLYPRAVQFLALIVFSLIIFLGFAHTPMGEDNFAVVITWRLWWLVLPFSFLLFGRLWCGICPVGGATEVLARTNVPWRRDPPQFLRKHGAWVMVATFLAFFMVGMIRHTCCWPRETAISLLIFTGGALAVGMVFRGRAWCRYFCPLGIFSGLFSMMGLIELRSDKSICQGICRENKRQVLQSEMEACPLYELPMALDSNRNCNMCGNCVKYCPHGSMRLRFRLPGKNLSHFKPNTAEAVFLLTFLGIVFVEVLQTTSLYPSYMKWAMTTTGIDSYNLAFTLTLLAIVTVVFGVFLAVSRFSGLPGNGFKNPLKMSMAYAYIPLALAVYLGVALLRLSEFGVRSVQAAVNELSFGGPVFALSPPLRGSFFTFEPAVKSFQFIFLGAGVAASLYFVYRLAGRAEPGKAGKLVIQHSGIILVLAAVLAYVFTFPAGVILH